MRYIGIDPGGNGGLACVDAHGLPQSFVKMPDSDRAVLDALARMSADGPVTAFLELVHSSPQMGVRSAFTFGMGYGGLRMALAASGIPYRDVTPQKWRAGVGLGRSAKSSVRGAFDNAADKRLHRRLAEQLFPSVQMRNYLVDALLIAEYGRRIETGRPADPQVHQADMF